MPTTKHIVTWAVNVYDSRKKPPLPLEVKHLALDWSQVPDEELAELKNILKQNDNRRRGPQPEGKQTIITMAWGTQRAFDSRLHKYRKYFVECTPHEIDQELRAPDVEFMDFQTLFFPEEYVEDEKGGPMTWLEMMDRAAGGPVLIRGDVRSVLRFGPANLKEKEAWEQRNSDLMQQFLRVVERLWRSDWAKAPVSMTWTSSPDAQKALLQRLFPTEKEIVQVLAWMRQIYSSDDLFNHTVNVYLRHVDDTGKHMWMREVKADFNSLRESPPSLTSVKEYTRQELIDLLAYGARVLHRKSDSNAEARLAQLREKHGDPEVAMAINTAIREILNQTVLAYHLIKQDFEDWLSKGLVPKPQVNDLGELFKSDR